MPPASLSTLEVISPGPTTARSSVRRRRRPRMRFCRSVPPERTVAILSEMALQSIGCFTIPFSQTFSGLKEFLLTFDQARDYVIDSDYVDCIVTTKENRQTAQIVFVK